MAYSTGILEEAHAVTGDGKQVEDIPLVSDRACTSFVHLDVHGFYRFVSKRYEVWSGSPAERFIGKHYSEIVGEEVAERVKGYMDIALSGHVVRFEACLPYKNIGTRRVISEYFPDIDKDGRVEGLFALVHDITDQAQAEGMRRESEQHFRLLFDHNIDGIFSLDLEGHFTSANPTCEAVSGYSREALLESSFASLVADKDRTRVLEHLGRVLKGIPQIYETAIVRKDGLRVDLKVTMVPINVQDHVVGAYGIIKDVSSEKKAQESGRSYMKRLEILNQVNAAILNGDWKDATGIVLDFVGEEVPCERASITLFDFDDELIEVFDARLKKKAGLHTGERFPLGPLNIEIECLRQGKAYALEDILALPDPPEALSILAQEGIRSFLAVPILYQGKLIGSINLGRSGTGPFNANEVALLQEITNQLSSSFENARVHEKLKEYTSRLESSGAKRARWLDTIYNISRTSSQASELTAVLEKTLEQLLNAMTCPAMAIQLITEEDERMVTVKGIMPSVSQRLSEILPEMDVMARVISRERPLFVSQLKSSRLARHLTLPDDIGSYLGIAIRMKEKPLGVLSVFGKAGRDFSSEDRCLLISVADHLAIAIEQKRLAKKVKNTAVLSERQRVARDLHDAVSQSLYSLRLLTEATQRLCDNGDLGLVKEHLALISKTVKNAIDETRIVVDHLRQPDLEIVGLVRALQHRLHYIEKVTGLKTVLRVTNAPELSLSEKEVLYFVAQEAINNVLKHAEATSLEIELGRQNGRVEMAIRDNGKGFCRVSGDNPRGMGIMNMEERARERGGSLSLWSRQGKGTTIRATLPQKGSQHD